MLKTVSNGQSIHQYIPPHLRRIFYNNPAAIHASQNGKDSYGFPTEGLMLYLPLWALKGSGFKSTDAYRHSCAVTGAVWGSQGRTLDGDDYINPTYGATLYPTLATFMCWVKSTNDAGMVLAGWTDTTVDATYQAVWIGDGVTGSLTNELIAMLRNPTNPYILGYETATRTELFDGAFHHVAVTFNGTTCSIYLDGASKTVTVGSGSNNGKFGGLAGVNEMNIGSWNRLTGRAGYLTGSIGDVWLYNRALSAVEIQHNRLATMWRYQ